MFEQLTAFIPKLYGDNYGEWHNDKQKSNHDSHILQMPFVAYSKTTHEFWDTVDEFLETHPEFDPHSYIDTLASHGIQRGIEPMSEADVSVMDVKGVLALLMGALRAEHFCDGALLQFLNNGSVVRWLERLKVIDEASFTSAELDIEAIKYTVSFFAPSTMHRSTQTTYAIFPDGTISYNVYESDKRNPVDGEEYHVLPMDFIDLYSRINSCIAAATRSEIFYDDIGAELTLYHRFDRIETMPRGYGNQNECVDDIMNTFFIEHGIRVH